MNSHQTATVTALISAKKKITTVTLIIWMLCCVALLKINYPERKKLALTIKVKKMPNCWFLGGKEQCCHVIVLSFLTKVRFSVICRWGTTLKKQSTINRWCINILHPTISIYAYSPYCSLYISLGADKENLFKNQDLL